MLPSRPVCVRYNQALLLFFTAEADTCRYRQWSAFWFVNYAAESTYAGVVCKTYCIYSSLSLGAVRTFLRGFVELAGRVCCSSCTDASYAPAEAQNNRKQLAHPGNSVCTSLTCEIFGVGSLSELLIQPSIMLLNRLRNCCLHACTGTADCGRGL